MTCLILKSDSTDTIDIYPLRSLGGTKLNLRPTDDQHVEHLCLKYQHTLQTDFYSSCFTANTLNFQWYIQSKAKTRVRIRYNMLRHCRPAMELARVVAWQEMQNDGQVVSVMYWAAAAGFIAICSSLWFALCSHNYLCHNRNGPHQDETNSKQPCQRQRPMRDWGRKEMWAPVIVCIRIHCIYKAKDIAVMWKHFLTLVSTEPSPHLKHLIGLRESLSSLGLWNPESANTG